MKSRFLVCGTALSALAVSLLFVGCDRPLPKASTSTVGSRSLVKANEQTAAQNPDGATKMERPVLSTLRPWNPEPARAPAR